MCYSYYTQTSWDMFSTVVWSVFTLRFTQDFLMIFNGNHLKEMKGFNATAIERTKHSSASFKSERTERD